MQIKNLQNKLLNLLSENNARNFKDLLKLNFNKELKIAENSIEECNDQVDNLKEAKREKIVKFSLPPLITKH